MGFLNKVRGLIIIITSVCLRKGKKAGQGLDKVITQKKVKPLIRHDLLFLFGWETRIRTLIDGVRVRCPTVERSPSNGLRVCTHYFRHMPLTRNGGTIVITILFVNRFLVQVNDAWRVGLLRIFGAKPSGRCAAERVMG